MASFPSSVVTTALLGGVANGIATTLSADINNSTGTIPVVDTTGFPTAGYATIGTEIISYTGKTSNSLTGATRGVDGTAAASHLTADAVNVYIVAAHVSNLQAEVIAIETDINARFGIGASSNAIEIPTGVSLTIASTAGVGVTDAGSGVIWTRATYDTYAWRQSGTGFNLRNVTDSRTELQFDQAGGISTGGDLTVTGVASPNLYVLSTSGVEIRLLASGTTAGYIQTQSNHPLYFTTNNGSNYLTIETNGNVTVPNGDLYTVALTDYSGTSTVSGWASFTSKAIFYKKVGKLMFVYFDIRGTSNSTGASFTVPTAASSSISVTTGGMQAFDNGVALTSSGQYSVAASSATVNLYKDMSSASWTNSGTKICIGWFCVPI